MDTIIGLGNAGCNIADMFGTYSQYNIFKLDVGLEKSPNSFPLQEHSKIEDYEEKQPNFHSFLRDIHGEVLVVIGGGGKISSASLAILECLKKKCKINILYIKPSISFLNETQQKLEKLVYNVLQEYTRSGVFEKILIVSNEEVESIIGGVPVNKYYEKLNESLVSTIHMINVYKHNAPVTDTFIELPIGARIASIGISNLEKKEDKMFFSLDNVSDVVYYYAYNKDKLESDVGLMNKIKEAISSKKSEGVRVTYGIFETDYKEDYVYCINYSSIIQK